MSPRPRQLKLPFDGERPVRTPERLDEVVTRLARLESRLVQLMKHQGMTDDGRKPLPTDHATN